MVGLNKFVGIYLNNILEAIINMSIYNLNYFIISNLS